MVKRMSPRQHHYIHGADISLPLVENFGYNNWHQAARLPWHSHHGFEIVALLEGSAAYEFEDGGSVKVAGGEFYASLPGLLHRGAQGINPPSKMCWIVFDPSARTSCRNTTFLPQDVTRVAAFCRAHDRQSLAYSHVTSFLLDQLTEAITSWSPGAQAARLRSLLCQILLEMTAESGPEVGPRPPDCVEALKQRIEKDFAQELNMDEIAAGLGLSRSRLYTTFHAATGHTPNDFLLRLRIRNAQCHLAEGVLSITEVAFATGFNSSQYFCKAFRKYTGQTPTDYRRDIAQQSTRVQSEYRSR